MSKFDVISARFSGLHAKRIDLSLGRIERLLAPWDRRTAVCLRSFTSPARTARARRSPSCAPCSKLRASVFTSTRRPIWCGSTSASASTAGWSTTTPSRTPLTAANARMRARISRFFEITTAAAFLLFADIPADYLLLEVGLGGRFDATNVIDGPAATVITPVSIDHPEFLGATIDRIAFEKAGILKRGDRDHRRAGPGRARGARARGATGRRPADRRRARLPCPRRTRTPHLRRPRRTARPAAAASGRPTPISERRDGDRRAASGGARLCVSRV